MVVFSICSIEQENGKVASLIAMKKTKKEKVVIKSLLQLT